MTNRFTPYEHRLDPIDKAALVQPIPLMHSLREQKQGYSQLPIDSAHPLHDEPVVSIHDYGIAGQAYYSRPNATSGDGLPGMPKVLYVRESVAKALAMINEGLTDTSITEFFGGEVELYVEDALRSVAVQTLLFETLIPGLLRKNTPDITGQELAQRRSEMIATPSSDPNHPSPHATGGAIDVILRFKQQVPTFVPGTSVMLGHKDGDTSERINPDYFEYTDPITDEDRIAQRNRRAFYAIMTGAAFKTTTGLVNNPTEWWHWSMGDQLAAKVSGNTNAYYSLANDSSA